MDFPFLGAELRSSFCVHFLHYLCSCVLCSSLFFGLLPWRMFLIISISSFLFSSLLFSSSHFFSSLLPRLLLLLACSSSLRMFGKQHHVEADSHDLSGWQHCCLDIAVAECWHTLIIVSVFLCWSLLFLSLLSASLALFLCLLAFIFASHVW